MDIEKPKSWRVLLGCPDLQMGYEHKSSSTRGGTGTDCTELPLGYENELDSMCDQWKLR